MKTFLITIAGLILFLNYCGCNNPGTSNEDSKTQKDVTITSLTTQQEKVSYCIGTDIGTNFKRQEIEVDIDMLAKGLKDVLEDAEQLLTVEEKTAIMEQFQKDLRAKQTAKRNEMTGKNKAEGQAFLAENGQKEGVITLESGLQYKVIKEGDGVLPKAEDTVVTQYRGTLIDGTEFDSSYKRGKPATFPVKGVIKGWQEALQLMKVGSKWELYVPSELAYGSQGSGNQIGPNAALIFEIELLEIQ